MDEIFIKYPLIKKLNVSRETCLDFEKFISMILDKNKEINIVSSENASKDIIMNRHIIDSAQIIDFVDFNYNTTYDLGTGGGFPGLVIAIIAKNKKKDIKIKLFEKSYHKSSFLIEVSRKLNLNTEVIQEDIFKTPKLKSGTIMARAFKPLPVVLDLVHEKFLTYKNLIIFMGKTGKKILEETLINWELEFEEKKSISSEDSFLLNIKKIKKKNNI
jgi:16S rRNA (guanine527-N7)-methyltransferase